MTTTTETATERWLICEIDAQHYAMSVQHVTELVPLRDITIHRPPSPPPHIAGMVDLRSEPIAVVDVRSVLGMTPMQEETDSILGMLRDREADHVRWIEELLASIREEREFNLATDPHQCAFGKWYDKLLGDRAAADKFANGDLALLEVIDRFDVPHKRIHSIAQRVTSLASEGKIDEAEQIITEVRETDLRAMIELFQKARELIVKLRRGVIVVLELADGRLGALVDNASEVRRFSAEDYQPVNMLDGESSVVQNLVQDSANDRLIQLLDAVVMYNQCMPDGYSSSDVLATPAGDAALADVD